MTAQKFGIFTVTAEDGGHSVTMGDGPGSVGFVIRDYAHAVDLQNAVSALVHEMAEERRRLDRSKVLGIKPTREALERLIAEAL